MLRLSEGSMGVDAFTALICSKACWNVVAMFSNRGRSIVILVAFVGRTGLYISYNCLRAWNISCWTSISKFCEFVVGVVVGRIVMVGGTVVGFSSALVGGVWASFDYPGGS
jgi:hypothetical protein